MAGDGRDSTPIFESIARARIGGQTNQARSAAQRTSVKAPLLT